MREELEDAKSEARIAAQGAAGGFGSGGFGGGGEVSSTFFFPFGLDYLSLERERADFVGSCVGIVLSKRKPQSQDSRPREPSPRSQISEQEARGRESRRSPSLPSSLSLSHLITDPFPRLFLQM